MKGIMLFLFAIALGQYQYTKKQRINAMSDYDKAKIIFEKDKKDKISTMTFNNEQERAKFEYNLNYEFRKKWDK